MSRPRIYLLYVWTEQREGQDEPALLRIALEEPHTGRRWGFSSVEDLVEFVEEVLMEWQEGRPANQV